MNTVKTKGFFGINREGFPLLAALCILLMTVSSCDQLEQSADEDQLAKGTGNTGDSSMTEGNSTTEDGSATEGSSASDDSNANEPPAFTGAVTSKVTGFMSKGKSRQFRVNPGEAVRWEVQGGSEGGGTTISDSGSLSVGANEANITLTVKAISNESDEVLGTATVKVRGWHEITENLSGLIWNESNKADISLGISAAAYGIVNDVGGSHGRWVVAGTSSSTISMQTLIPVIVYSDNDGETWAEGMNFANVAKPGMGKALLEEEVVKSLIYDGPEGDKKFIMGTYCGNIFWSYDGINWTKVWNVFNLVYGGNRLDPLGIPLYFIIYGTVNVNGVPTDRYIATGPSGMFAYSSDGKVWEKSDTLMLHNNFSISLIQYGTGNGNTKMFYAEYIAPPPGSGAVQEDDVFLYSIDGANWTSLTEGELTALNFQAAPPAGAYQGVTLSIDTKGEAVFAGDDNFTKKVNFVAAGNGYIMAVGNGRRAAIAHQGAY
jgi:hypothetical protein